MIYVKSNFPGRYQDLMCQICGLETECQQHIMSCNNNIQSEKHTYSEIFGRNIEKMVNISKLIDDNMKKIEKNGQ